MTPGWYRIRGNGSGLEFVADLDHEPDDTIDLVKVEISGDAEQDELW